MKKEIITITGSLGSGKTSTANALAQALGYERFSAGDFQRQMASSLGLTYDEYQKVAEKDPQYDRKTDELQKTAGETPHKVIDGRLAFHFIPDSFKLFLYLDPSESAQRILMDAAVNPERHKETLHGAHDAAEVERGIVERFESERKRYKQYYGVENHFSPSNFDMVINTKNNDLKAVVAMALAGYQAWRGS